MAKIKEEFADRIPIVRACYIPRSGPLEEAYLDIWYVVETRAMEDAVDLGTNRELWERTRDELLFSGYFRDRRDVLTVKVVSEERLEEERGRVP